MNIFATPENYAEFAFINHHAIEGLWDRLNFMTVQPKWVLDLGCGTGEFTSQLRTRYKDANIIGLDLSNEMLTYANQHYPDNSYVQARARVLPFASQSIDLITANLLLPWLIDIKSVLQECKRVLKPNGLLTCTIFGPDTLRELRSTAADYIIPNVMDMHDLGDLLVETGFSDPVLDVNIDTLVYCEKHKLLNEFICSGLMGSDTPTDIELPLLEATFEIVYAHAFTPTMTPQTTKHGETSISLASLKQQLREKS